MARTDANTLRGLIQLLPINDPWTLALRERTLSGTLTEKDHYEIDQFGVANQNINVSTDDNLSVETHTKRTRKYFVTFNPKPEYSLKKIKRIIKQFIQRKNILNGYYVYEQRSLDIKNVHGLHVHLLIETAGTDFPRNTKQSILRKYVGQDKHIHVYHLAKSHFWKDKLNYIKGDKKDVHKLLLCKVDKLWRKQMKLKSLYKI